MGTGIGQLPVPDLFGRAEAGLPVVHTIPGLHLTDGPYVLRAPSESWGRGGGAGRARGGRGGG
ncbi:hypothetical protein ACFXJB_22775, partial [Streptomyces mirabilis]